MVPRVMCRRAEKWPVQNVPDRKWVRNPCATRAQPCRFKSRAISNFLTSFLVFAPVR